MRVGTSISQVTDPLLLIEGTRLSSELLRARLSSHWRHTSHRRETHTLHHHSRHGIVLVELRETRHHRETSRLARKLLRSLSMVPNTATPVPAATAPARSLDSAVLLHGIPKVLLALESLLERALPTEIAARACGGIERLLHLLAAGLGDLRCLLGGNLGGRGSLCLLRAEGGEQLIDKGLCVCLSGS